MANPVSRLLSSIRQSTQTVLSSPAFRRLSPLLLLGILTVYLLFGAAAFFFLEHNQHEKSVRKWYMNQAVNRKHFARSISSRIFNDTRNLLIIIDREQTERVQQLLVESLKRYEERQDIRTPDKKEWNMMNSLNYAFGLLTTLGHGVKLPETAAGQIFAVAYSLIGVPLFFGSLAVIVYKVFLPAVRSVSSRCRFLCLNLAVIAFLLWALLLACFLYCQVFDSFWRSAYTAVFAALTIQLPHYSSLPSLPLFCLLLFSALSTALAMLVAFLAAEVYCGSSHSKPVITSPLPIVDHSVATSDPPKFTVVVDEAGESKLLNQ